MVNFSILNLSKKSFALAALMFCLTVNGWAVNYVSWDFTPSITNANYASGGANQTGARSTALSGATLSAITINGGPTAVTANTLQRTTGWPTATSVDNTKYLEF